MSLTPTNPVEAPISNDAPNNSYIQPDLGYGLRIWWAFYWRSLLISSALTVIFGLIVNASTDSLPLRTAIAKYSPFGVSYLVAIFVFKYILGKKFRHFRIALVSPENSFELLPVTFRRTIRVWWIYCWRTLIYALVLTFAASILSAFITGVVESIFPSLVAFLPILIQQVIGGMVGLFVIYSNILDEQIGDFQVTLLPVGSALVTATNPAAGEAINPSSPTVS